MKPFSLGDSFYACYYARDPEWLERCCKKAEALEEEVRTLKAENKELERQLLAAVSIGI